MPKNGRDTRGRRQRSALQGRNATIGSWRIERMVKAIARVFRWRAMLENVDSHTHVE